jgi:predicted Ser/Thr protein kinase
MQRMQQTSLVRFCDECGFANKLDADECAACQSPLVSTSNTSDEPQVPAPVKIAPSPVLEVTPGAHFATALPDVPREFKRGTLLKGRYYIQEELGRGGFSIVYHAVDLKQSADNGGEVAIKRIQLSALTPRQVIDATETFNREITMLARFKGVRGIPRFYEQLTDPENWYLVMEYVRGETLEDYLRKRRRKYLPEYRVIKMGIRLTQILRELHKAHPPVIFRDLKPANIMLTSKHNDYDLYLIDFGIARNHTPGKAKDTIRLGSPDYAPQEQYGSAQTDQRSDIYSLGATLQTLLTGCDPLDLRAGEASLNPKAPSPGLRKLLDQMLDSDPEQRPADMEHVQKSLRDIGGQSMNFYLHRLSYMDGLIRGVVGGIVPLIVLWQTDWMALVGLLAFPLAIMGMIICRSIIRGPKANRFAVSRFLLARLFSWVPGRTKSERRYFLAGLLTVLLFYLLILLWHMFSWPL